MVLVNSNPATIMTDSQMAHATYIEPLTVEAVEKVIAKERPDAILPTMGGQTGLNLAIKMAEDGILDRYGVELLGVKPEAIAMAEDRNSSKRPSRRSALKSAPALTFPLKRKLLPLPPKLAIQ